MRLLYVCSDPGVPLRGRKGASVHVRALGSALATQGDEVLWALASDGGPEERPSGEVVRVAALRRCDADMRAYLAARAVARDALAPARAFGPDVVYERLSLFGSAGLSLARALDVPLVVEVNAPLVAEAQRHRGLGAAGRARLVERTVLRSADRVVVVSERLRRWVVGEGVRPEQVTVLANAVDPVRFRRRIDARADLRRELEIDDEPAVGFVGTLKPWHDVAALVRAAGLLTRSGRGLTLVVVGDGPEREALKREARREGVRARFAGAVPHDRVALLLAALDVGVLPYAGRDVYFSPLKLFEYLAAELPVVAADAGDVRCCVADAAAGVPYAPGDDESLAGALEAVLADADAARARAARGRRHVLEHHTWSRNAEAVVQLARAAQAARLRSAA